MTDGIQPLSGRVMCEHYLLSVLMYTPGMSVMTFLEYKTSIKYLSSAQETRNKGKEN